MTIVLKDNASLKLIVADESQLLASASGNTLPVDKSYQHLSGITIQPKVKGRRKAYSSTNIVNHILSMCQNRYLCKNNMVIDSEIDGKIKKGIGR
jgi:hypothetical protein